MPKIAMIGAGSMIFTKTLAMDILAPPGAARERTRADEPDTPEARPDGEVPQTGHRGERPTGDGLEHTRPA